MKKMRKFERGCPTSDYDIENYLSIGNQNNIFANIIKENNKMNKVKHVMFKNKKLSQASTSSDVQI